MTGLVSSGLSAAAIPAAILNYLAGLTLSTAGSSATFSIAAGIANDSTNVSAMALSSAYTKTTSAWEVGTGNGSLDTGAIANSTWYHVWLIQRVDTGVVDILTSLSATSPTMPTNYTLKRRIGAMITNGSAQWVQFVQKSGGEFWYFSALSSLDYNASAGTSSRTTVTLSVPTGVIVKAIVNALIITDTTSAGEAVWLSDLATADTAPVRQAAPLGMVSGSLSAATGGFWGGEINGVWTNTSAQIGVRMAVGTTNKVQIQTLGWIDPRGQ